MPSQTDGQSNGAVELRSLLALEQEAADLDASQVLGVLRRRWPIVLLVPVLFAVLGYGWSSRGDDVYEAQAFVVLRSTAADAEFVPVDNANSDRDLQTETQYINAPSFALTVADQVGTPVSFRAQSVFGTSVIAVIGQASDATKAAEFANAAADAYVAERRAKVVADLRTGTEVLTKRIAALQADLTRVNAQVPTGTTSVDPAIRAQQDTLAAQITTLRSRLSELEIGMAVTSGGAQLTSRAAPADTPVAPRPMRSAVLFGLLGVLLGVGAALVVDKLTDHLSVDELERRLPGIPMLASVPPLEGAGHGLALLQAPISSSSEAIRRLRTSLQFLALDRPLRRIQVTSAAEDEGASVVAANLAAAFAGAGLRVVVVDGDLRHPVMHTYFGVDGGRGFMTVLVGQAELGDALQPIAMQGWLRILTTGPRPTNPSELLASGHLGRLLSSLEDRCDLIIIDSPPVLPYTDAAVIASFVDATVFVASPGHSKFTLLRRALRTLRVVESNVVGVVLSELAPPVPVSGRRRDRAAAGA